MRALALDFDGVISDSAAEAFVVGLSTYLDLRPVDAWRELGLRMALSSREEILREPLYRQFLDGMPLGNRAEDFGVVLFAAEHARPLPDQAAYDAVRAEVGEEFGRAYHGHFYETRGRFRESEPERWGALLGPYPEFLDVLRRRSPETTLAIATAKDRPSVAHLLAVYGVADLFDDRLVLDKETGRNKCDHLTVLAERLDLPFEDITFIDDKVNHLDAVAGLGVRCGLAGWGYNGARERSLAHEAGHLVLDLDGVEAALFGHT